MTIPKLHHTPLFGGLLLLAVLAAAALPARSQPVLLHAGHSHNDYRQKQPLHRALDLGYTSVEIDVFSHRGAVKVSHVRLALNRKPDLKSLYLEPLARRIAQNGGTVFPGDSTPLVLMIDLKEDKRELVPMLSKLLEPYRNLLLPHESGKTAWAPVRIVLSGGPPHDLALADPSGIFRLDGSAGTSYDHLSPDEMPRVSGAYGSNFRWKGKGEMPQAERERLRHLVTQARREGRRLRFWAGPHSEAVWKVLLDEGVGWINVDDLERFRQFYLTYRAEP